MFKRSLRLQSWIDWYAQDHRSPVNHAIHVLCIPLIVFSSLGLLNWIPLHLVLQTQALGFGTLGLGTLGLGTLGMALLVAFFAWHDLRLALLALPFALLMAFAARFVPNLWHVAIFATAWIAQFLGHGLWEKNRPSLMSNLMSLFVAPAFLLDGLMGGRTEGKAKNRSPKSS